MNDVSFAVQVGLDESRPSVGCVWLQGKTGTVVRSHFPLAFARVPGETVQKPRKEGLQKLADDCSFESCVHEPANLRNPTAVTKICCVAGWFLWILRRGIRRGTSPVER